MVRVGPGEDVAVVCASEDRVLRACAFRRPDRIPSFDSFWEFPQSWRERLGDPAGLTDVAIWYPDETPLPSRVRPLKEEQGYVYEIDGWGRTVRHRAGAFFVETLEVAIPEGVDPAAVEFDPPELDARYLTGRADPSVTFPGEAEMRRALGDAKGRHCVFGKTGGPYLRSCYLRGETQFLIDMAADPPLARAVAEKITRHMIRVGLEELRRWDLRRTGIWIYDDMAFNRGPMFSPAQFERVLLPCYREMIRAFKEAGAAYVFVHSDGNVRPLLEMLVDAGIDGLNPLERRAGMDMEAVRKAFPRLILTGGMCNTHTLVRGTPEEIEAEARQIIDLGRDGGVIIGTHSISPEIPVENYAVYRECCRSYGSFV
jgi:uroporphyrinogen-III decarboxylase